MTETQKLAVRLLNDGQNVSMVAKETGISAHVLRGWNTDPVFMRARYMDITMRFGEAVPKAMTALIGIIEKKDSRGSDIIKAATEILDRAGFIVQRDIRLSLGESNERPAVFTMSIEDLREQARKVDQALSMIDVTPEEPLLIEEENKPANEDCG